MTTPLTQHHLSATPIAFDDVTLSVNKVFFVYAKCFSSVMNG